MNSFPAFPGLCGSLQPHTMLVIFMSTFHFDKLSEIFDSFDSFDPFLIYSHMSIEKNND